MPHLALSGAVPLVAAAGAHELSSHFVAALALGIGGPVGGCSVRLLGAPLAAL